MRRDTEKEEERNKKRRSSDGDVRQEIKGKWRKTRRGSDGKWSLELCNGQGQEREIEDAGDKTG